MYVCMYVCIYIYIYIYIYTHIELRLGRPAGRRLEVHAYGALRLGPVHGLVGVGVSISTV